MNHATSKIRAFDDLLEDKYADGKVQQKQLGFRGEALFSIANTSQSLIISTRTKVDKIGQRLEFRRDGCLNQNSIKNIQRKIGTTVAVVKLFDKLPVRRADMIKRIKAQRSSMLKLIQSYAVLCVGVRFNVIDISGLLRSPKCKTEVKLNTSERSKSIKDTVSAVFGSKFLSGMCPILVDLASVIAGVNAQAFDVENKSITWKIEGLVSRAPNACNGGKSARDVQFFTLNGRPVELPRIAKVMSAVWNNFESSCLNGMGERKRKKPACILRLFLPSKMVDVNLSPNKRQVLITEEKAICEMFRESVTSLWTKQTDGKFKANEIEATARLNERNMKYITTPLKGNNQNSHPSGNIVTKGRTIRRENKTMVPPVEYNEGEKKNLLPEGTQGKNGDTKQDNLIKDSVDKIKDSVPVAFFSDGQKNDLQLEGSSTNLSSFQLSETEVLNNGNRWSQKRRATEMSDNESNKYLVRRWEQTKLKFNANESKAQNDDIQKFKLLRLKPNEDPVEGKEYDKEAVITEEGCSSGDKRAPLSENMKIDSYADSSLTAIEQSKTPSSLQSIGQPSFLPCTMNDDVIALSAYFRNHLSYSKEKSEICSTPTSSTISPARKQAMTTLSQVTERDNDGQFLFQYDPDDFEMKANIIGKKRRRLEDSRILWNGFNGTKKIVELAQASRLHMRNNRKDLQKKFTSKSSLNDKINEYHEDSFEDSTTDNGETVSLSKADFLGMKIVGQFNLGFILATCEKKHLWILDQHACDERYNFEKICTETKMHEQRLLAPLQIELSPSEENCVLENMTIFEQNGFKFYFDESKPVMHRLSLIALPHSGSGGDGRKAVQFGKEDVGALCAILGADGACSSNGFIAGSGTGADGGGSMVNNAVRRYAGTGGVTIRLPKSIAMFASRACRSSVMIGEPLSRKQMKQIVQKLRDTEQPWDCPHGRPTMRHVKNLIKTMITDEDFTANAIEGPSLAVTKQR